MKKILYILLLLLSNAGFLRSQDQELDSLKGLLLTSKEDTVKAGVLLHLSEICDEKDILKYAEAGLKLSEKLQFKKGMAGCLNNIGYANNVLGNIPEALESWNKSLKIYEELNDQGSIAVLLNNMGFVYERQGLTEKGLDYYLKSLKIREKIDNKEELVNSINNLALLYHNHGDIEKSLELNLRNIKLTTDLKDERALALTLNNIAINYDALGNKKLGLEYLFKSLNLRLKVKDSTGIAESYISIGSTYYTNGQYDSAIYFCTRSYQINKNLGEKAGTASSAISLATAYFQLKKYKLSEEFAKESYLLSVELGFPEKIRDASKLLSQVYKEEGKYEQAYDMLVVYKQMADSINGVGIRNSMVKKQMQYEFDTKEERAKKDQEKKDLIAEEEKRIQNIIIFSVALGLIIVVVFSVFIFRSLQKNKKANKIITLQKLEVERQKEVVEHKNEIIEEKQKEILDSINYAKRIQYTLLAHADFLNAHLPEHFIFFNPKDIVSGDFYWAALKDNKFYLAVCDSTGHGVPGAFMSLLNIGFLSEAINEKGIVSPDLVLNYVRQRLTDSISKEGQKDGFDGILMCFDNITRSVTYAAAHNAPVMVSKADGTSIELDADKMPVGVGERKEDFKLRKVDYKKGDVLYLYTDGYADQFGGPKGKKFKYKPLNEMLVAMSNQDLLAQKEKLQTSFENWRGELEQVDDVLIIGVRL